MIRDFLKRQAGSRVIVEERQTSEESSATLDRPAHHNAGKLGPSPVPLHSMSGAALVLVLACLALLTVVVISLMVGATQELNTAKSYSEQVEARRLAASTLELVKGQIWAATTETNSGAAATSWASQPGAIRTFKSGDTNLVNVYKLYSSDAMVVPNSSYTPASEVPANWASRPNEFVDLNRPVVVGGVTNYPIFNPASSGSVVGFTNNASAAMVTTTSPLPMPVRWIYVLRDGTLTNSSVTNAAFNASNPVAGRIAFWTDDDTCKLNINTASATRDGDPGSLANATSFWDLPIQIHTTAARFEADLARYQPAQGEYQRYPGHPARVNLRSVFTSLNATEIYQIVPRTSARDDTLGSYGGTRMATTNLNSTIITNRLYASVDELLFNTNRTTNNSKITSTNLNQLEGFLTAYNRAPDLNLFGKPRVSMWPIHKDPTRRTALDRYFATASTMSSPTNGGSELYSVTREDPNHSTNDLGGTGATIMRLFNYLSGLTSMTPPGFTSSFEAKYGADGRDQLLTLSLDYIRCVNLYDSSVTTGNLTSTINLPYNTNAFSRGNTTNLPPTIDNRKVLFLPEFGQVVPLKITSGANTYKGLGRFDTTVSEALFHVWAMSWNPTNAPLIRYTNGISVNSFTAPIPVREDDVVSINGVTTNVSAFDFSQPEVYAQLAKINNPIRYGSNRPMYAAQFLVAPFGPMLGYTRYNPNYIHYVENLSSVQLAGSNVFPRNPAINWVRFGLNGSPAKVAGGDEYGVRATLNNIDADGIYDGKAVLFENSTLSAPKSRDYQLASVPFPVDETNSDGSTNNSISFRGGTITLRIYTTNDIATPLQTLNFNFPNTTIVKPRPFDENFYQEINESLFSFDQRRQNTYTNNRPVAALGSNGTLAAGRRMRNIVQYTLGNGDFFNTNDSGIAVEASMQAADFRWLSLQNNMSASFFLPHKDYFNNVPQAFGAYDFNGSAANTNTRGRYLTNTPVSGGRYRPILSSRFSTSGVTNAQGKPPDFENGIGLTAEGAYSRKPDEGDVRTAGSLPYDSTGSATETVGNLLFSPNRQVPSPGIMGGLPSRGTEANGAWETLLFCPNPAAGTTAADHRGFASPPDYLWLDLFTMPIVEPYPISEPFSTAGRINLNYQIVPFTYLTRNTGMHALFSANRISVCAAGQWSTRRIPIHAAETLKQFDNLFANNRLFRSPAEICSIWLFPVNTNAPANPATNYSSTSIANISAWWGYGSTADTNRFTGDNLREQPYTALYQNLTTQANTYTVHVYVQALDQAPSGKLIVTGEYRGSYALERFLDPRDPRLPDFMNATGPNAMGYYQFRVNNTTQFLP